MKPLRTHPLFPPSRMSSAHRSPNLLYPGGPLENCGAAAGGEDSGGNAREEGKVVVRTRTAPAGPHPYLDRFASGMHRPFEGQQHFFLSRVRYKCGTLGYGNWNVFCYFVTPSYRAIWYGHFIS